jgi:transcriptional regulator with XRE-family HTH domain
MSGKQPAPTGGLVSRRYALRDIQILRHCMANPGRGESYSVRTLADDSGVSPGVIEKLLTGRQRTADVLDATALAESLGVAILVLFAPPASPKMNRTSRTKTPTCEE